MIRYLAIPHSAVVLTALATALRGLILLYLRLYLCATGYTYMRLVCDCCDQGYDSVVTVVSAVSAVASAVEGLANPGLTAVLCGQDPNEQEEHHITPQKRRHSWRV